MMNPDFITEMLQKQRSHTLNQFKWARARKFDGDMTIHAKELSVWDEIIDAMCQQNAEKRPFERTALRGYEINQIIMIYATLSEFARAMEENALRGRLNRIGRLKQTEWIVKTLDVIVTELLETFPLDKLRTLQKNIRTQALKVVTNRDPANNEGDWSYVNAQALRGITAAACRNECLICEGEPCDMAKCALRKALKAIVLCEDERDANGGMTCVGKILAGCEDV